MARRQGVGIVPRGKITKPNTRKDKETNLYLKEPVPDAITLRENEAGLVLPDPAIMTCKKCIAKDACPQYQDGSACRALQMVYQSVVSKVPHLMGDYKDGDDLLIEQLAKLRVLIARADIYFALFDYYLVKEGEIRPHPLLMPYRAMNREFTELCKELGLSPMARHKLKEGSGGPVLTLPQEDG